jgi:branched-chain amino acid transport system ATP-binding protein
LSALLEVNNLTVLYDKAIALASVSLHVDKGEIVSIVGANGAGKTTILRSVSGLKRAAEGEIWFDGRRIDKMAPYEGTKLGIAHIPAGRMIFANMSVLDNIKMGAFNRRDGKTLERDIETVFGHFPILKERQKQSGAQLSGGEQQMLAIARALVSNPKLLLMDEPSTGLSPLLVGELGRIVTDINRNHGVGVLLVEQNCRMALKLSSRAYILELGKIVLQGTSKDLVDNERVKQCYLGG